MKPRVTIITLGVDDLQSAVAFYRDGLGWQTPGIIGTEFEHGAVAFFDLNPGVKLALWPRDSIAHDSGLTKGPRSSTELTLAHNVNSAEDVDAAMALARSAGATVIKEAGKTFYGGYAGYFTDPDGHVWEVAWNPQIKVSD
jgi:catechol 2,3-dioxygenase-like lactoylglutathione lyase family enzyme